MKETSYDRFMHDIAATVSAAAQYFEKRKGLQSVGLPSVSGDAPVQMSNLLEWGMLHALYELCAKCRDPNIRRKACSLLFTARRREGPLKSETLAMYASAIIHLEEDLSGGVPEETFVLPGLFADAIPEYARFSDVVALSRPDNLKSFRLVCGRFKHADQGQIKICRYQFIARPKDGCNEMLFEIIKEPGCIEIPRSDHQRHTGGMSIEQKNTASPVVTLPVMSRPLVAGS